MKSNTNQRARRRRRIKAGITDHWALVRIHDAGVPGWLQVPGKATLSSCAAKGETSKFENEKPLVRY
jgi:hypothetical protein